MPYRVRLERDPHPFARGGSFAICAVSVMHAAQAGLLFWTHAGGDSTPVRALLFILWTFGIGPRVAIPILITTSALAMLGAMCRLGWVRLLVFVPQHFCLGVMAFGGLYAASRGSYLDGVVMPWGHILTDQLPISALFAVHTSAIVRRARDPNG